MTSNNIRVELLFIEDRPDDAELAVRQLQREGFAVTWRRVDTERDLRSALSDHSPDLILSDYSMPGFSGTGALRICHELVPDIPFIFLSGTIGEELAIESIHNGATDYVLKDNMKRLTTSIKRALNDKTERERARAVEKERSRLIAILEATSDFVAIAHPDNTLAYLNQGGRNMVGHQTADVTDLTLKQLYPAQQLRLIQERLKTSEGSNRLWQGDSLLKCRSIGEIPVSQVVVSHVGTGGDVEFYSFIARDIRDRKAYEKKIEYLANYDSLTDMPNRTLLADRVTQAINYSHWTNRSIALLVVDIDRFKTVNDGYGHEFGDELLRKFAERLRATARTRDTIARISGNCFAILATELASPEDVIILVSRLQHMLVTPFEVKGNSLTLTVCIGISVYPRDGNDFVSLMRNADAAMHKAKERSNGGFQFYTVEMTSTAIERVNIEAELHHALAGNQLELHYQPQVSIADESLVGFEALMRWNHPQRGFLSPALFIPIAENSELICKMGEWALFEACRQMKEWDSISRLRPKIAVNVSMRQFRSQGFAEMVQNTLQSLQLEPNRLELEVTESLLVHDRDEVARILNSLGDLGVRISLDDFGTGYSSLGYLSRLPITSLKIDKGFVQNCLDDKNDREIVRAIISLAESLELGVVAEGIETAEQLELLRKYGCDEGQGYLFSRPERVETITSMLAMQ
ncbi:MAG TPA: EAL domain-containing protein [Candidatus Acidoferrum sp.]|nr:EAL domain-containing protein [Candidatus Acidoferrum sp.]